MFRAISKFFSKRDRLCDLSKGEDRHAFIRALGEADIFVMAHMNSKGLDVATLTQDQLLAEISRAAHEMNQSEGCEPFVYEAGGRKRLPFFSSMDHAQTFCGEYSRERSRVFPFQVLGVKGALLARLVPACDELALNDKTERPFLLSQADISLLHELWDG